MLQGRPFEEKMEELHRERKGEEGRRQVDRRDGSGGRRAGMLQHLGVTLLLSIDLMRAYTRPCVSVWDTRGVLEV